MSGADRVVIAVLTYQRVDRLAQLLPLLLEQADGIGADVLVVDNDPGGSAGSAAAAHSVRYVHEPHPGIAAARNRALAEAGNAAALVFIDDDELPGDGWLAHLVGAWRQWSCAAVSGPVRAEFATPPPRWVQASGAFERRVRPSGSVQTGAPTNNLLLDLRRVRDLGLTFDDRFGLTGGEDTMFSHELVARGGEIRWCDEAEVIEPVAPERATRGWVLRRGFRAGTTWAAMELALAGPALLRARLSLSARAVGRIAVGVVRALSPRREHRARAQVEIVSCAGMLLGAYGSTFREYRRN
jgi:glycosyltransferase involved in cell wall biosynthesis